MTPLNILARKRFTDRWGYFAAGGNEATVEGWMHEVSTAASKAGMTTRTTIVPDAGHSWAVPTSTLPPSSGWDRDWA